VNGQKPITLLELKARRTVVYVETMYGGPMGLRRLSVGDAMALRELGKDQPEEANRRLVLASVVEPALDDDGLHALENDMRAFMDLIAKILEHNGLGDLAQKAMARTFRAGDSGPGEAPSGGAEGVPVPPGS
jgi:hypothetical protein